MQKTYFSRKMRKPPPPHLFAEKYKKIPFLQKKIRFCQKKLIFAKKWTQKPSFFSLKKPEKKRSKPKKTPFFFFKKTWKKEKNSDFYQKMSKKSRKKLTNCRTQFLPKKMLKKPFLSNIFNFSENISIEWFYSTQQPGHVLLLENQI